MTKAIYLVGPMGCGKSSTMAAILDLLGVGTGDWFRIWPTTHDEFRGEPLEDIVTGAVRGLYLGIHRGEFSGTDAIGMASHSEAVHWLEDSPELPDLILGEGARLCTKGFLTTLAGRSDLTVGYLTAPQAVLDERLERRWATQDKVSGRSESFRKGTATRAINAVANEAGALFRTVVFDTSQDSPEDCAKKLLEAATLL